MRTSPRRTQPPAVALAALFLLALTGSCKEDRVTGTTDTQTVAQGTLLVTVITTGGDPDNDGYGLVVDNAEVDRVLASSTRTISLAPGNHAVELTDVAPNCLVGGDNRRTVELKPGGHTATTFNLDCPHLGALEITTEASGEAPGPKGFLVYVNGERRDSLGPRDRHLITLLRPQTYQVRVAPIGAHCTSDEGLSREAVVPDGGLGSVRFDVTCMPRIIDLPGEKLLVARPDRITDRNQLLLMTPDGQASELLAEADPGDAVISTSADGRTVLYLHWTAAGRRITILDIVTLEETTLPTPNISQAALSPDGSRIAFIRFGQLVVMLANGQGEHVVVPAAVDGEPYWSPDGRQVALTRDRGAFLVNADGGQLQQIGGDLRAAGPWSPDGRSMLLTRFEATSCTGGYYYYYYYGAVCQYVASTLIVHDMVTGQEQILGGAPDTQQRWSPAWASDGRSVFFLSSAGNGIDVFNVGLDGSAPFNVTNSSVNEQWIAVTSGPPATSALRAARRRP